MIDNLEQKLKLQESKLTISRYARGFNYIVFDENAVTIEDKIQFMQTPNGIIYGAKLPDGTIYLNPEFLNANTPIHEFSHLFEQLLPSRFKKGVELLKQTNLGKKLFDQLKQEGNYANLTDEQLWGEALNTHIGNFGENEVNNTKGKLKQLQDWIKDFFVKVGDVLGIKKLSPDTQLRMFTEGVVNLTDEQLWSKALNTHIGNFGENEVNNTKGKLKQ